MESLPPELHTLILELACALFPGSQTTRALSLTSTRFHAIAAPFLFHTIAVQEQATPLLALLAATPAHQRRIHRLFTALTSSTATTSSSLLGALFRIHLPQLKALSVHGFYPLPRPGALRGAPAFARELRAALGADDGTLLPLVESVILEAQADAGGKKPNKVAQARDVEMRDILRALGTLLLSPENSGAPRAEFLDKVDGDADGMKSAWFTPDCP
ncbi:hypothetical protein FB451DRAFT_1227797 [Mycena latifolia]|nr:hypothetical protein FB451DRAFT_1227797 [Mycena latifolia]